MTLLYFAQLLTEGPQFFSLMLNFSLHNQRVMRAKIGVISIFYIFIQYLIPFVLWDYTYPY